MVENECLKCYYKYNYRIALQAFTAYTCKICNEVYKHPNSLTPLICPKCCDGKTCCRCGFSIKEV